MLMDPYLSQQHSGSQHAILQPQQEVTRPNGIIRPTLPRESGVDGAALRCQHLLVSHFTCTFFALVKIELSLQRDYYRVDRIQRNDQKLSFCDLWRRMPLTRANSPRQKTVFFKKKWAIHCLFFFIFRLFYKQLTVNKCSIKVADGWIRTLVLWYWKQLLCQLRYNHCPTATALKTDLFT